jgi:hypothetical protein
MWKTIMLSHDTSFNQYEFSNISKYRQNLIITIIRSLQTIINFIITTFYEKKI